MHQGFKDTQLSNVSFGVTFEGLRSSYINCLVHIRSPTDAKTSISRSSASSVGAKMERSPTTSWNTPPGTTISSSPLNLTTVGDSVQFRRVWRWGGRFVV